jgi:glycosyltransferase involved in cell wall biosynthesis
MIAFFSIAPFLSGSERCLQLILLESKSDGMQPILVTSRNSPLKKWAQDNGISHFSVELNPIKVNSKTRWLFEQVKLTIFLNKKGVKVIHSNQIWSYRAALLPAKVLRAKLICHFRDPIDSGARWWLPRIPDLSIFVSSYIQKQFCSNFEISSNNNLVTMLDPVKRPQEKSFNERETNKRVARAYFHLDPNSLVLGFIGQISPVKGLLTAIDVVSRLERNDWTLLVVGNDPSPDQQYLKKCIREVHKKQISERVIFLGFQDDISSVYEAVDLIIMFSTEEPLGLIPLEAGGFYKPSIVTNVGGLPETVNYGQSGWIIDPVEYYEAVTIIENIKEEDLAEKGDKARRFTESINDPKEYWQSLKVAYIDADINKF